MAQVSLLPRELMRQRRPDSSTALLSRRADCPSCPKGGSSRFHIGSNLKSYLVYFEHAGQPVPGCFRRCDVLSEPSALTERARRTRAIAIVSRSGDGTPH